MQPFFIMKGFLKVSAVVLLCVVALSSAQRKKDDDDKDNNSIPESPERSTVVRGGSGRCACRDLENQLDSMEIRLDKMVETWNDFVDKNRNREDGPHPGRRPPGGGRPYDRPPHYPPRGGRSEGPRYWGNPSRRGGMDDQDDRTPRARFNF